MGLNNTSTPGVDTLIYTDPTGGTVTVTVNYNPTTLAMTSIVVANTTGGRVPFSATAAGGGYSGQIPKGTTTLTASQLSKVGIGLVSGVGSFQVG